LPCCAEAGLGVASIRCEANGGIEIECGESSEAGTGGPGDAEVSARRCIYQWEAGKAGADCPSTVEVSTSSSVDQREAGEAGADSPSVAEVSTSSSIDQWEAGEAGAAGQAALKLVPAAVLISGKLVRLVQLRQAGRS
jgi:hypothetical protein